MHMIVDLSNQIILPIFNHESLQSWLKRTVSRIKMIVNFCVNMKLKPIFVSDAAYTTQEVKEKWKSRREKEVERCFRKIPYCADTIVCELILKRNLHLVYDRSHNADDIIATLANMHPNNLILSRDTDYFRYDQGILKDKILYIDNKNIVKLECKKNIHKPLQTIRMYVPKFCVCHTELSKLICEGVYKRGTVYPKAERSLDSSLHLATRNLRKMLYKDTVREIFPIWNGYRVVWIDELVDPDNISTFPTTFAEIKHIVESSLPEIMNKEHTIAINLITCELFCEKTKDFFIDVIREEKSFVL